MEAGPLIIGRGGWCALREDIDGPDVALVRFAGGPNERLRVVEILLRPPEGIDSDTLRELPLARIEARANVPENRERLLEAIRRTGRSSVKAAEAFEARVVPEPEDAIAAQRSCLRSSPRSALPAVRHGSGLGERTTSTGGWLRNTWRGPRPRAARLRTCGRH
jgi:hypothetical protein